MGRPFLERKVEQIDECRIESDVDPMLDV